MILGQIVKWLKEVSNKTGADGFVFGLSGGIDSAVVGGLVKKAVGTKHLGLILPCQSSPEDLKFALETSEILNLRTKVIDLSDVFETFTSLMPDANQVQIGNIKARLRMTALYHHAAVLNYLVAGTANKTEYMLGYFTKWGDGAFDVAPIIDFLKRDVRMLGEELGLPSHIIDRPPSAGLWEGQTDEEELGWDYDILDSAVIGLEKGSAVVPFNAMQKVFDLHQATNHKREPPLHFKKQ
ncbi:NAD(+) synthase [bacterium]|nr:NAD(+) synthase [candidate division CSSED10-310 bacterium]